MKIPKERKTYCPNCKKHTIHHSIRIKKKKGKRIKMGSTSIQKGNQWLPWISSTITFRKQTS